MYIAEVSIEGNQPIIQHVTSAVHCNTAVNPLSVEAQIQGGALMGIGTILKGSAITMAKGVVDQSNFHDYNLPGMPDMPAIDVHIVSSRAPPKGIREPVYPPLRQRSPMPLPH